MSGWKWKMPFYRVPRVRWSNTTPCDCNLQIRKRKSDFGVSYTFCFVSENRNTIFEVTEELAFFIIQNGDNLTKEMNYYLEKEMDSQII